MINIRRVSKIMISMFLIVLMVLVTPVETYAGTFTPTSVWKLNTKGQYNFEGKASWSKLYTNYKFTGVSSVKIKVSNKHSSKQLVVKVIEVGTVLLGTNKTVQTVKVPVSGTTTWTKSISSSEKYYLSFSAPSNFSGYIKKS